MNMSKLPLDYSETNLDTITLNDIGEDSLVLDHSRLVVYQFLSIAFTNPQFERWQRLLDLNFLEIVQAGVEVIRHEPLARSETLARGEISLAALNLTSMISFIKSPTNDLVDEYNNVFGLLISRECPPYETEYCPQTFSVYRSQHLADIAGFYHAFGLEPSNKYPERQDHIILELEFMAWLIAKTLYALKQGEDDNASLCRDAQKKFVQEHLAWWTPAFAFALRRKADGIVDEQELAFSPRSYQGALGAFLAAFIAAERGIFGISPPTELLFPTPVEEEDSESCATCSISNSPTK